MPYIAVGEMVKEKLKNDMSWFEGGYTQEDYDRGKLVPDETISSAIMREIELTEGNCILDGFPRTTEQSKIFTDKYKSQYLIVDIAVDFNLLIERASNRRICAQCNEIYALKNPNMLPKPDNTCVKCGGEVIQRSDDKPESVMARLDLFARNYEAIIQQLLSNTTKGINFAPGNNDNIDMMVDILAANINVMKNNDAKIIIQLFE